MSTNKLHIVLVDHLTGGHHLAFMGLYAKCLIQLGHEVSILYPEPEKVTDWLKQAEIKVGVNSCRFEIQVSQKSKMGRWTDAMIALGHWNQTAVAIKKIDQVKKVDFVFFNWLDSYLACNLPAFVVDIVFKFRWTGLYLHPRHMRLVPELAHRKPSISDVDHVLQAKKCFALTIHDRGIIEGYRQRLNGKKVLVLPETADLTAPGDHLISLEIKKKSKGRTVVGVIGLMRHQGIFQILELINLLDKEKFFVVFIGQDVSHTYSDSERLIWNQFKESLPNNCFLYLNHLREGFEYNSIFNSIDIPFLVYKNFSSTSNRLTKAAAFRKLVISSNQFCIAEDVFEYHLGLAVNADRIDEIAEGIIELYNNSESLLTIARFSEYSVENSENKLSDKMKELTEFFRIKYKT